MYSERFINVLYPIYDQPWNPKSGTINADWGEISRLPPLFVVQKCTVPLHSAVQKAKLDNGSAASRSNIHAQVSLITQVRICYVISTRKDLSCPHKISTVNNELRYRDTDIPADIFYRSRDREVKAINQRHRIIDERYIHCVTPLSYQGTLPSILRLFTKSRRLRTKECTTSGCLLHRMRTRINSYVCGMLPWTACLLLGYRVGTGENIPI